MSLKRALVGGTFVSVSVTQHLPCGGTAHYHADTDTMKPQLVEQMMMQVFGQVVRALPAPQPTALLTQKKDG
jgi:hypothetical protein